MALQLDTAPTVEPFLKAEAKLHLRQDETADDDLIDSLIIAARQYGEMFTGRAFITQTWDLVLDRFPTSNGVINIPKPPLQSISSINYVDTDGNTTAYTTFDTDTASEPGRILPSFNEVWPATRNVLNAVTIQFVAGFGLAADVPEEIKAAMKLTIGNWYENREAIITQGVPKEIPLAAKSLYWSQRILQIT